MFQIIVRTNGETFKEYMCDQTTGHHTVWTLPVVWVWFFATVNCFGCALLSITTGNAWRLFLEDREGWSHMSEAAWNYGEEWNCNYELRRLEMHGGWGGSERRRVELWRGPQFFFGHKHAVDIRLVQIMLEALWDA